MVFLEAMMLSQSVWDQMLESEKQKVRELENKYAEFMKAANVRLFPSFGVLFIKYYQFIALFALL